MFFFFIFIFYLWEFQVADDGTTKIADFGLSRTKSVTHRMTCDVGTAEYMAPYASPPSNTSGYDCVAHVVWRRL